MKSYISKKVCSLESKLWSVICSQNWRSSSLVMEADVIPRRRANASNNSPAKSFESFIPIPHSTTTSILRIERHSYLSACLYHNKFVEIVVFIKYTSLSKFS